MLYFEILEILVGRLNGLNIFVNKCFEIWVLFEGLFVLLEIMELEIFMEM